MASRQSEMLALKQQAEREQAEFEREWEELGRVMEQDRMLREAASRQRSEAKAMDKAHKGSTGFDLAVRVQRVRNAVCGQPCPGSQWRHGFHSGSQPAWPVSFAGVVCPLFLRLAQHCSEGLATHAPTHPPNPSASSPLLWYGTQRTPLAPRARAQATQQSTADSQWDDEKRTEPTAISNDRASTFEESFQKIKVRAVPRLT